VSSLKLSSGKPVHWLKLEPKHHFPSRLGRCCIPGMKRTESDQHKYDCSTWINPPIICWTFHKGLRYVPIWSGVNHRVPFFALRRTLAFSVTAPPGNMPRKTTNKSKWSPPFSSLCFWVLAYFGSAVESSSSSSEIFHLRLSQHYLHGLVGMACYWPLHALPHL
jgi:hypothetical protein